MLLVIHYANYRRSIQLLQCNRITRLIVTVLMSLRIEKWCSLSKINID